jgi:hypothetical protein
MEEGLSRMKGRKWNTETKVRYNDPPPLACECNRTRFGQPARLARRSTSCSRQDDDWYGYLAKARDNRKKVLKDRSDSHGTDSGRKDFCAEEKVKIYRAQKQDQYNLLRDLRKRERVGRDHCNAAEKLHCSEEYYDNCRGREHEPKHTARNSSMKESFKCLDGHFFHKEEGGKLNQDELWHSCKNENALSRILRREPIDSRGSLFCDSHSSSRSRSTTREANANFSQMLHSRSGTPSSSRCLTPRQYGRSHRTVPFRKAFVRRHASRSENQVPEEGFKRLSGDQNTFSQESTRSKSQPPQSSGPLCKACQYTSAALAKWSVDKTRDPGTSRRMTLIQRYKSAYRQKKSSTNNKGSLFDVQKSRSCSCCGEVLPKTNPSIPRESYRRRKSEEGLSPLRSPWRQDSEESTYEERPSFHPQNEDSLPHDFQERKYCQIEQYDPSKTNRRRERVPCVSPQPLKHPSWSDEPSSNFSKNTEPMGESKNCCCPLTTGGPYTTARDTPHTSKLSYFYNNADAKREPHQHEDPETTRGSFLCTHSCPAKDHSFAPNRPRPTRNFCHENTNEREQTTEDAMRSFRPSATKDSFNYDDGHTLGGPSTARWYVSVNK